MEDLKQTLAKHCDRVAWAVVALVILVLLLLRNLGGDPVKTESQEIDKHLDTIGQMEEDQKIPPLEIPKTRATLEATWVAQRPIGPGGNWILHRKPLELRVFREKVIDKAQHTPPILTKVSVIRSAELKKPIVVVEGEAGQIANVRFTSVEIYRADKPEADKPELVFKKVKDGEVPHEGLGSGAPIRFEDKTVESFPFNKERSYYYKLRTVVQLEGQVQTEKDYKPQYESVEVSGEIKIPPDLGIELVTAQPRIPDPVTPGSAYLRVEMWDYDAGAVKKIIMRPYKEIQLLTEKPADEDFIPGTSLYVWVVESGTQVKLKDWKTRATYTLKAGDPPAPVALPAPWEKAAAPPPEKAEEKKAKIEPKTEAPEATPEPETPEAETPEEEPSAETPAEPEPTEKEAPAGKKAKKEDDNPFK